MNVSIREARTEFERESIFRFRYDVYVREIGYPLCHANHARGTVVEPFDATAHQVAAFDAAGTVVGCIRTNAGEDTDFGYYEDLYAMRAVGNDFPKRVSVTTKFIVAPTWRGRGVAVRLARAACAIHLRRGIRIDFIDCDEANVPFYRRIGYREYTQPVMHPEYGRVVPMKGIHEDLEHLRRIRSPLAVLCEEWKRGSEKNAPSALP